MEQDNLFARCRDIPALDAARALGMTIRERGGRHWTLCPLHGDKDPSLLLDNAGRWHCFGCGQGGDALDLYARVTRQQPALAARRMLADCGAEAFAEGREPYGAQRGAERSPNAQAGDAHPHAGGNRDADSSADTRSASGAGAFARAESEDGCDIPDGTARADARTGTSPAAVLARRDPARAESADGRDMPDGTAPADARTGTRPAAVLARREPARAESADMHDVPDGTAPADARTGSSAAPVLARREPARAEMEAGAVKGTTELAGGLADAVEVPRYADDAAARFHRATQPHDAGYKSEGEVAAVVGAATARHAADQDAARNAETDAEHRVTPIAPAMAPNKSTAPFSNPMESEIEARTDNLLTEQADANHPVQPIAPVMAAPANSAPMPHPADGEAEPQPDNPMAGKADAERPATPIARVAAAPANTAPMPQTAAHGTAPYHVACASAPHPANPSPAQTPSTTQTDTLVTPTTPATSKTSLSSPSPRTVAGYAAARGFDLSLLAAWGVADEPGGIVIPYRDAQGQAVALRRRLDGRDGRRFAWHKGARMIPYGLWLPLNQGDGALVLCEGESDAHALWHMGVPALGIPGAATFKAEWAQHMLGRDVFLHVEPGSGGQTFLERTARLLRAGGFAHALRSFSVSMVLGELKDPSDLLVRFGRDTAAEIMKDLLRDAAPVREPGQLDAYRASDLNALQVQRPPEIVRDLLQPGLCLLAGAPKRGKSWLALALALSVTRGEPFLTMDTMRGAVLYLDLESRQHRVKQRLDTLCIAKDMPDNLFFSHEVPTMDMGLLPQLAQWVARCPDTKVIIVDTLARVKGAGKGGENVYEADTRIMGEAQRFALDHGLCLLFVHHLRKQSGFQTRDVYEMVSGSTGITGVCDSVLVLTGARTESEAQLHVSGRDVTSRQLALRFDAGRWTLENTDGRAHLMAQAYAENPLPAALRALVAGRNEWEGTPAELAQAVAAVTDGRVTLNERLISKEVDQLAGMLLKREGIACRRKRVRGMRLMVLTRADAQAGLAGQDEEEEGFGDGL